MSARFGTLQAINISHCNRTADWIRARSHVSDRTEPQGRHFSCDRGNADIRYNEVWCPRSNTLRVSCASGCVRNSRRPRVHRPQPGQDRGGGWNSAHHRHHDVRLLLLPVFAMCAFSTRLHHFNSVHHRHHDACLLLLPVFALCTLSTRLLHMPILVRLLLLPYMTHDFQWARARF